MSNPLIGSDGKLDPRAVVAATLGLISSAVFGSIADIIRQIWHYFVVRPVELLSEIIASNIAGIFDIFTAGTQASYGQTASFVAQFGVGAWLAAIVLTIGTAYAMTVLWGARS